MRKEIITPPVPNARPFLKWAGGKGQLIPSIEASLPVMVHTSKKLTYVEPFIGSGAVLFWVLQQFSPIKKAIINDINPDLTGAYSTVKNEPRRLIDILNGIQETYYTLKTEAERKDFFLEKRAAFNARQLDAADSTALLIFLNRTCFNGLYRVNSRNQFNVPFGTYIKPKICDAPNIVATSRLLQKVTILNGDYSETLRHVRGDVFYYLDPPYKPISRTSSFNSYAKHSFGDSEQVRLKAFCDTLTKKKVFWLMSNSDPKNNNPNNNFFDDLYAGRPHHIGRVPAKRNINSNAAKRGDIAELLISNYTRSLR